MTNREIPVHFMDEDLHMRYSRGDISFEEMIELINERREKEAK